MKRSSILLTPFEKKIALGILVVNIIAFSFSVIKWKMNRDTIKKIIFNNKIGELKIPYNYNLLVKIFPSNWEKIIRVNPGTTLPVFLPTDNTLKEKGIVVQFSNKLYFLPFDILKDLEVVPVPQGIQGEIISSMAYLYETPNGKRRIIYAYHEKVFVNDLSGDGQYYKISLKYREQWIKGWMIVSDIRLTPVVKEMFDIRK